MPKVSETENHGERKPSRRRRLVAVGMVGVMALSGVAYAYWTMTGAGTGTATHATPAAVVVNQATPINTLFPGVTVPLSGTFSNPNTGAVTVTSVTVAITSITDATVGSPACTTADYEIVDNISDVTDGTVTPGAANGAWSGLSIRLIDSGTNQDSCKDATVNLTYTSA